MKRWMVPAVALLLTAMPVVGQEQATIATDGSGDLHVSGPAGEPQPMAADDHPSLDLVGLSIHEGPNVFTFGLGVRGLEDPAEAFIVDDTRYTIHFEHNGVGYQIHVFRALADQEYYWHMLQRYDSGSGTATFLRFGGVAVAGNTMSVDVLRDDLVDMDGAAPYPGRQLDQFWVESHLRTSGGIFGFQGVSVGGQWDLFDRMPNSGVSPMVFAPAIGLKQSGAAELYSTAPMRASNGEATTYVYSVTARNHGPESVFAIALDGAPSTWDVRVPHDLVTIGAGAEIEVPVLVSTPFAHSHGAIHKFLVTMTDERNPENVGRVELGVRFHAVPQPAGHHDQLWLHSQRFGEDSPFFPVTDNLFTGGGGLTFMNTLADDPSDQGVPVKGSYSGYGWHDGDAPAGDAFSRWGWQVWLSPDLEMGMDFDLDGTGSLSVPIQSAMPLQGAVASGRLVHLGFDSRGGAWTATTVADLPPTAPREMGAGSAVTFNFDIKALPAADLLPRAKMQYFGIELNLTSARPAMFTGAEAPELAPGGTLTLPLFEYREPIDEAFASLGELELRPIGARQKAVNPGETVLFEAMLANAGAAGVFDLAVAGTGAKWASLPAGGQVGVAAGESARVVVAVGAPFSAKAGAGADFILEATRSDDLNVRSLIRFVAVVETATDYPDQAVVAESLAARQEAPAGFVAVFAVLAALFVERRRR